MYKKLIYFKHHLKKQLELTAKKWEKINVIFNKSSLLLPLYLITLSVWKHTLGLIIFSIFTFLTDYQYEACQFITKLLVHTNQMHNNILIRDVIGTISPTSNFLCCHLLCGIASFKTRLKKSRFCDLSPT